SRLRRLSKALGVDDAVTFVGHVQDPFVVVGDAVVVVCSRREGFSRVQIEAMKCGLPVISAGTRIAKEFIRDDWNGSVYEVGDAQDLADKVESILKDEEHGRRLATAGQRWAMNTFTTEKYVRDFM